MVSFLNYLLLRVDVLDILLSNYFLNCFKPFIVCKINYHYYYHVRFQNHIFFVYSTTVSGGTRESFTKNSIPLAKAIFACKLNVHDDVGYCRSDTSEDYGCICSNKDAISSFVGCFAYYQENSTEAVQFFVDFCNEYGDTTVEMDDIYEAYNNYTTHGYYNASALNETRSNYTHIVNKYDKVDTSNYTLSLESSIDQFLVNWDNTFYYGAGILGFGHWYYSLVRFQIGVVTCFQV